MHAWIPHKHPPPAPSGQAPPTPREQAPPQEQAPPRPGTPQPGTSPPGPGTPLAQSRLGDTVSERAVRILLECNLVCKCTDTFFSATRRIQLLHVLSDGNVVFISEQNDQKLLTKQKFLTKYDTQRSLVLYHGPTDDISTVAEVRINGINRLAAL